MKQEEFNKLLLDVSIKKQQNFFNIFFGLNSGALFLLLKFMLDNGNIIPKFSFSCFWVTYCLWIVSLLLYVIEHFFTVENIFKYIEKNENGNFKNNICRIITYLYFLLFIVGFIFLTIFYNNLKGAKQMAENKDNEKIEQNKRENFTINNSEVGVKEVKVEKIFSLPKPNSEDNTDSTKTIVNTSQGEDKKK